MTKVQSVIYSEYKFGFTIEQIAKKYALIPKYVHNQLKIVLKQNDENKG